MIGRRELKLTFLNTNLPQNIQPVGVSHLSLNKTGASSSSVVPMGKLQDTRGRKVMKRAFMMLLKLDVMPDCNR